MSINHIIFSQPISAIWEALGGATPRRGRASAFYRKGDNPGAVSLNDEKGCWHDFVTGYGGGVLDLVQHIQGGDRTHALRWLANLSGLPLDERRLTSPERQTRARGCARVRQLAQDVADFEHGLELRLEHGQRDAAAVTSWLLSSGVDPGDVFAGPARGLAILGNADSDSLVQVYRELPEAVRGSFRDAGRLDREHSEAITRAIVALLAQVGHGETTVHEKSV